MLINTPLSRLVTRYGAHYVNTWRHPQNRKYTMYRNAARGWPSHSRSQRAQKLVKFVRVVSDTCERTDRQTDRHSSNEHLASFSGAKCFSIWVGKFKEYIIFITSPPAEMRILRWSSLFICLSVCSHISKTTWQNFTKFCYECCLWSWLCRPLETLRFVMYFRFRGWRLAFA